ncbi:unnamed protein product [Parnassius mnemosyne]|uniref:Integrase catalytic domain-containing protein n=1 Tax=Parnassius mnemosyne TaxID=213953 RepID=A0AAV1LGN1_9NEOP
MEGLINVQLDLHNSIKKGLSNFKKSPKERLTKEYVEARLENLERDWLLFRSNNTKLFEITKQGQLDSTTYVSKEIYEITEDNYLVYKSLMKNVLSQFLLSENESNDKNVNSDEKPSPICKRRHHSLLHPEEEKADMGAAIKESVVCTSSEAKNSAIVSCLSMRKISGYGQVLLATALVNAESKSGGNQIVRALLDQGSQACFITEAAAQLLQLKKSPIRATITGLGEDKALTAKYVVTINLKSRIDSNYKIQVKAYVLKNITSYLPEQKIESIDWIGLQELCLADPKFNVSNKIDMLLGANVFSQILMDGVKRSPNGSLIAQNTTLGWIVSGIVNESSEIDKDNNKISVMHAQINEHDILKQFWELEEQPRSTKSMWSEEEQKCEEIFTSTTKRTTEGRYIVKLPFRDNQPRCLGGGSRKIAVTKFKALEKRLSKDLELKKNYTEVINEYLQLGHMRRLRKDNNKINEAVYLPHHAVVRKDKTTTKVRVVFNASSKNNYGVSLNETLMIGPTLQADLRHLVMRWRIDPIVLVADVIKMYRQVRVAEDNTKFQRIVWRENPESEIEDFELLTVTFGIASAPYLAVRVLNQISLDEGKNFPLAAPRVLQAFYMDDLMTGCCDVKEGLEVYKQMTDLLARGGFKLQKWNSNNEELLSQISINEKLADMNEEDTPNKDMLKEYKQRREMQEGNIQDIQNILKLKETESLKDNKEIEKFSSLQRLLRVIAYCRRFNRKNKCTERKSYLTKTEIDHALMCCIKKVQKEEFGEEYLQLKEKGLLSKSSKLKSLCPYLDNNDIMRVSGRLQNSQLPAQTKYPIILPHSAYFTKLVISEAHQNTLHGGVQLMVNYLRTMYWIIGVKNLAKQHVRRCVTCVRQNAKVQNPFMGSLPAVRCTPARAFLHSGVDYAGPINIRTTKGRGHHSHKGYICLFICMSTRAIHLEAVNDMSTQAFLAAFRRFVARRGHCTQIWSDNGTTFVGASRELEQLKTNKEGLATYLESHGTEWHFIPPHAPNFGGLWEAGVKSTKLHLKRVIGESTLTFEEMSTLLSQIEACLNSRPITVDSSDPSDPLPLTPGHFLIGGPLIAVPEFNDYLESNISSLKRWQFIQQMLQHFWRRWSQEYLSNLMNRYKWSSREPEPNIGDVVLVKEDNLPPSRWLMGRIVEKHPGIDNVTRVVTIRTKSSFIKRPTSKLCVLPVRD